MILFSILVSHFVLRIVYVGSIAALNYPQLRTKDSYGQNPDHRDMYYNSKNNGEKLVFELAKKYKIELVAVLSSALQHKMTYLFQFVLPSINGIISSWITIQFLLFLIM